MKTLFKHILVALLNFESKLIVRKYKPFIVAVTGSVGKTSAKDAIYAVLKDHERFVRKSDKSMNSEIGLPLTVIGAANSWYDIGGWFATLKKGAGLIMRRQEYPTCLVLELGADHPGDIRRAAAWLPVNVAVITKVSRTPVHVEFFASPEAVFEEKVSLLGAVRPGGTVVLFADDEKVMSAKSHLTDPSIKVVTYGTVADADVRGLEPTVLYEGSSGRAWKVESTASPVLGSFNFAPAATRMPTGLSFKTHIGNVIIPVTVRQVLGQVYMYPLLAAAAVATSQGMNGEQIRKGLNEYTPPRGRMNLIRGIHASTLVDDTYNSSPDAVRSALESLRALEGVGSKIAVLGDMMELGKHSAEEHRAIGREVAAVVSRLITVGQRSRATAEEAVKAGLPADMVRSFDTSAEVGEYLSPLITPGSIVLVKGSQSIRMERVVEALMDEPSRAGQLLVRQEKEWLLKK